MPVSSDDASGTADLPFGKSVRIDRGEHETAVLVDGDIDGAVKRSVLDHYTLAVTRQPDEPLDHLRRDDKHYLLPRSRWTALSPRHRSC